MKKIFLLCAVGMSSSLVVQKMREGLAKRNVEADILARSEAEAEEYAREADLILVAPQAAYMVDEIQEICDRYEVKMAVLPGHLYGRMDADKLAEFVIPLLE